MSRKKIENEIKIENETNMEELEFDVNGDPIIDETITPEDYEEGNKDFFDNKNIIEETIKINSDKTVDYVNRGFKTLEEAYNFVETEYFKNLGKADQEEYIDWLY